MAKPQNLDKLVLSVVATVVAVTAFALIIAGSFVPRWARPLNSSRTDANTTYSLWGQEDCYGIICTTEHREESYEIKRSWKEGNERKVEVKKFVKMVPITTCVVANYCNMSWFGDIGESFLSQKCTFTAVKCFCCHCC
ncbi:hypothetical protein PoB_005468200 [Plakobranchus ocellatus]|uniref:Uncharacterized protein n=1 Tax=Plakobranchus ocellatus TaxID=259542 RepID=A0AAV4C9Y5_9GAST|nr:hypothetical protein PoB_005468200 [Plakobranchus ocellatus]